MEASDRNEESKDSGGTVRQQESCLSSSQQQQQQTHARPEISADSRQHHHDGPPAVASSSTTSTTAATTRVASQSTSNSDDLKEPEHQPEQPLIQMTVEATAIAIPLNSSNDSGVSSNQFSANSNYSSNDSCCSNGNNSNRSGFRSKGGRSIELRKLPMSTSLFSTSKTQRAAAAASTAKALVVATNNGATSVTGSGPMPPVIDNSDSTRLEEDEDGNEIDDHDLNGTIRKSNKGGGKAGKNNSSRSSSNNKEADESWAGRFLRSTCLRSNFSLQTQLLLSFGMVSTITILLVVSVCVAVSILSGNEVNDLTRDSLQQLSYQMEGKTVRYVAEALSNRLLPDNLVDILHDAVADRFVGYPDYPGYENDSLTPFRDVYSKQRIYPVKGPAARLDWDLQNVVTPETAAEHVQERYGMYSNYANITTSHAAYIFQGSCNPNAVFGSHDWYMNCTDANNNIATGGVVRPVSTNQQLFERGADLTPLLKAIYEDTHQLRDIGVCFANGGAGSCLTFPAYPTDGTERYISDGCDWMKEPNPYKPSQPIGTAKMIENCHPKGSLVPNREYNPLEREWCSDLALNPEYQQLIGPFSDAWGGEHRLVLAGKAVYDPMTSEFVGCIFQDFTIAEVQYVLEKSKITNNSHVTISRWDPDVTVAASTAWNLTEIQETPAIHDLGIGVDLDDYQLIYNMVNYSIPWDPQEVRDTYANTIHHDTDQGYLVAAYPMPPVPSEYDPKYRPQWLIIMSVSTADMLEPVERLNEWVDDKVEYLVYVSFVAGLVGWGVVMALIIIVSRALTLPLKSMNQTTSAIVDNFGGSSEKGIVYNAPSNTILAKCTPETEVSLVVSEFEKMVCKFSGHSKMAKAVQERFAELGNHFCFEREFEDLYESRQEGSFKYGYETENVPVHGKAVRESKNRRKRNHLHLMHFGSILTGSQAHLSPRSKKSDNFETASPKGKRLTSPLFIWIVVFIVTPLLITTVTMSAIVTFSVSDELTEVIKDGKAEYVQLEKFAIRMAAGFRANWIAGKTEKSTRDLHIVTRYASWLLFDGLERRDIFTELKTGAEECKAESNPLECAYIQETCHDHDTSSIQDGYPFRYTQKAYFVGESHDTLPNGDRNSSLSFPSVSFSPETTGWWENATSVPGHEKGSQAAGYETAYDRLRVLSAIPVFQNIFNYATSKEQLVLQSAVAMEADGMMVGYHGCSLNGDAVAAFWESSSVNHGLDIRPNLCPAGKFGYDARCREWYDTGRKLAQANTSQLYITAPYQFATDSTFGQTCTSPLVDPRTQEHIGQTFVDFKSDPIFDILAPENTILAKGGFPLLIAARPDQDGADAIVGPGFKLGEDTPKPIEDIVFRHDMDCADASCQQRRAGFQSILRDMKSVKAGQGDFSIRMEDGSVEQIFIAYAPVVVSTFHAVNSSDFKRGIKPVNNVIFFLALAETEVSLVSAFHQVEEDISLTINVGLAVLIITIVLATALVVFISYWVAISVTEPMLYFLQLIRHINELDDDDILVDFDLHSGSREVKKVANTMGTLHKIVQCANSAYFAGDIDKAYVVLQDSARLFKRLENKKAVGVANNNLGNTMLAVYRTMRVTGAENFCGLNLQEVVLKGMSYFHQAIKLGEKAYDEFYDTEGWSPSCLDFMQHLANRYFNRAMFLLTVKDDHENPKELEELGMRDLQIARDMDVEIVDQGTEVGWNVNTVDNLFNVSLNRARGHLLLLEMGYPDEWDIEELLEDLFNSLKNDLKSKRQISKLFHELAPAGRMQQVDTELMRYKMLKGDMATASSIAIRMLMEDEFILPGAQVKAIEVLLSGLQKDGSRMHLKGQLQQYLLWLGNAKSKCDTNLAAEETTTAGEDLTEVIMMSVAKLTEFSQEEILSTDHFGKSSKNSSLLAATRGDVTMEIF